MSRVGVDIATQKFELGLRKRIQAAKGYLVSKGFAENHCSIEFNAVAGEKGMWSVTCGNTYADHKIARGELLRQTVFDVLNIQLMAGNNKLKLLGHNTLDTMDDADQFEEPAPLLAVAGPVDSSEWDF